MTNDKFIDLLIMGLEEISTKYVLDDDSLDTLDDTIITLKQISILSRKRKLIDKALAEVEAHLSEEAK